MELNLRLIRHLEVKKLETDVKMNSLPSASTEFLTAIDKQIEESLKDEPDSNAELNRDTE